MIYRYTVRQKAIVGDILLLTLVPKYSNRRMQFTAGQYAALSFRSGLRPTPARCFSIVSSPQSGALQFAMRIAGNFTQTAARLQPGDVVTVQGPFGEFTIDEQYDRQLVMLASGIGITPFMSMLRDHTERQLAMPITLWYSNRTATDIPFYDELLALQSRNPYLDIRFFSGTQINPAHPQHVMSTIGDEQIAELRSGPFRGSTYFICGSEAFSKRLREGLLRTGVHETRILSESFTQSSSLKLQSGMRVSALTYSLAAVTMLIGTAGILAMDVSRSVSHAAPAGSLQTAAGTSSAPTSNSAPSSSSSTDTSNSNSSNTSANSSSSNYGSSTNTTPQTTYYYQPPVSSVS